MPLLCSLRYVSFVFKNRALPSVGGKQSLALFIFGVVWSFQGEFLADNSISCNPLLALEVLLRCTRCVAGN